MKRKKNLFGEYAINQFRFAKHRHESTTNGREFKK